RSRMEVIIVAVQDFLDSWVIDGGLEHRLFRVVRCREINCVTVGRPVEAPSPLIAARSEFLDLAGLPLVDTQAEKVRLIAVASLRGVSDVASVRRKPGSSVRTGIVGRDVFGLGGGDVLRASWRRGSFGDRRQIEVIIGGPGDGAWRNRTVRGVTNFRTIRRDGISIRRTQKVGRRIIAAGREVAR